MKPGGTASGAVCAGSNPAEGTPRYGIEQLPITITIDGRRHDVRAGQAIDYSGERMVTPDGEAVSLTNIVVHPAGPTLRLAPVEHVDNNAFGIDWSGEGATSRQVMDNP